MFKKAFVLILSLSFILSAFAIGLSAESSGHFSISATEVRASSSSQGRYINWAGTNNISQFTDKDGKFCFAWYDSSNKKVMLYITDKCAIDSEVTLREVCEDNFLFGGAIADEFNNYYLFYGLANEGYDTDTQTVFLDKYDSSFAYVTTLSGNGSEGIPYYYPDEFHTKEAFEAGNCDLAINGDILAVNYARLMYSGHQANAIFAVNLKDMTIIDSITDYNSHSFDQRITPYGDEGGFLAESLGDAYNRTFTTTYIKDKSTVSSLDTFNFWLEEGVSSNMYKVNKVRARLGNILVTANGAALVASSARSLSEDCIDEPYDVFVQIFDPSKKKATADTFVTVGVREGKGGIGGDKQVTDYGVKWLTDNSKSGLFADVVQAVSINEDYFVILYELYNRYKYISVCVN